MTEQPNTEMKNSDAPVDQDQVAPQAPAEVDGLAEKAEQAEKESEAHDDGGYGH